MYRVSSPALAIHARIPLAMNSGPLSLRMCAGAPRPRTTPAKTTLTPWAVIPPLHLQGQALPRVLVHQREPFQSPTVAGAVVQEVPRPDVVLVLRRPPHAAVGAAAQPPLFPPLSRHFQALLP